MGNCIGVHILRDFPENDVSEFFIHWPVSLRVNFQAWALLQLPLRAAITGARLRNVNDLVWPSIKLVSCVLRRDLRPVCKG